MTAFRHAAFTHEHPKRTLSLRTRTRLLGTLNLAIALRGRSCGWGACTRPRRTFYGHHRPATAARRAAGRHFVELVVSRGLGPATDRVLFRIEGSR